MKDDNKFLKKNWALVAGLGLLAYGYQQSQPTAHEAGLSDARIALEQQMEIEAVAHELRLQQIQAQANHAAVLQQDCIPLVTIDGEKPVNIHKGMEVQGRNGGQMADGTVVCDLWGTAGIIQGGVVAVTYFNAPDTPPQTIGGNENGTDADASGGEIQAGTVFIPPKQ